MRLACWTICNVILLIFHVKYYMYEEMAELFLTNSSKRVEVTEYI